MSIPVKKCSVEPCKPWQPCLAEPESARSEKALAGSIWGRDLFWSQKGWPWGSSSFRSQCGGTIVQSQQTLTTARLQLTQAKGICSCHRAPMANCFSHRHTPKSRWLNWYLNAKMGSRNGGVTKALARSFRFRPCCTPNRWTYGILAPQRRSGRQVPRDYNPADYVTWLYGSPGPFVQSSKNCNQSSVRLLTY